MCGWTNISNGCGAMWGRQETCYPYCPGDLVTFYATVNWQFCGNHNKFNSYDSVISNFLDTFLLENYELFSLVYQKRRIDGKFFRIRPVTCPAFGVRWGRCLLSVYGERYSHDRHTSLLISATHILTQQQTSSRQSKQSPIMLELSKVTKTNRIEHSIKER